MIRRASCWGLDIVTSENHEDIRGIIKEVVEAVDPEVVVTDDHGAYTEVVDDLGLEQQICPVA